MTMISLPVQDAMDNYSIGIVKGGCLNKERKLMRFWRIIGRDPFSLTQIADHQQGQMCRSAVDLHETDSSRFNLNRIGREHMTMIQR